MPLWVEITGKLAPVLVTLVFGSIGAYIAYNQFRTNRDKLRLDLFEKRLEAYEKLQEYFNCLLREGKVTDDSIPILHEARYKSLFVFGADINAHIEEVWKRAFDMRALRRKLYGPDALPVGDERSAICEQEGDLMKWCLDQQRSSPERYAKYLKFD